MLPDDVDRKPKGVTDWTNSQWQGLGDVINLFRTGTLGLPPLTIRSGAGVLDRLKVPYTYTWSQGLIPKPDDWKENIGESAKREPTRYSFDNQTSLGSSSSKGTVISSLSLISKPSWKVATHLYTSGMCRDTSRGQC